MAAELKEFAAKVDSPDDGFQVGAKWVGTYTYRIADGKGKQGVAGMDLEMEITKRSGKEFTLEFWANKRKAGYQYEGTIDKGQFKWVQLLPPHDISHAGLANING